MNHSPDFHTETAIDKIVKQQLLRDTFKLLQLDTTFKKMITKEEKWKTGQRIVNADKDI